MSQAVTGRALLESLPPTLPTERIISLNTPKADLHTHRRYEWDGWEFDLPPGVFLPGATSRMIHERVRDGDIAVAGRAYLAMGVGLGIEAIVAGLRGARVIYALDVHPESVRTTARYYERLVGQPEHTTFVPVVADVLDGFPAGVQVDVITFNPPAVSRPVSEDPDVVRNVCVGRPLLAEFFAQIVRRDLLAPGGEVFVIASNTADLRGIIGDALGLGFTAEVHYRHEWHDDVRTYLFRLQRGATR